MQKLLLSLRIIAALGLAIPTLGWAADNQTTTCSLNNQQRVIEVVTGDKGCEVHYTKGSEEAKTLWSSARSEYCAKPAADFIDKQKSWGWSCSDTAATAAAPADSAPAQ
jgi:hypothetical protein